MIPFELITLLGSGLMGGLMTLWGASIKARAEGHKQMLDALAVKGKLVQEARQTKHKEFQFTRRILALMSVFAVIVLPKLAALYYPEVEVTVGYTEWNPGFWFFTDDTEVIRWVTAKGLTITPLDSHFTSAVAGLYFGSSVVRNS